MNDIFNIRRFGRYLLSDIRNCMAGYGLSMALISLTGLIAYIITAGMSLIITGTWASPELEFRIVIFLVAGLVLFTSMPAKCYGGITEKRKGTSWLMVPVSATEKFLSMVIMTVFIVPLVTGGVYLAADAVICTIDPACGKSLIGAGSEFIETLMGIPEEVKNELSSLPALKDIITQMTNPLLYIDDIIMVSLSFLLGAVCFKKAKTAKTFLAIIVFSIAMGFIATPIIRSMFPDLINPANINMMMTDADLNTLFDSWIFRNAALIDTINDTVTNLALMAGIFFRIRTLKH